MHYELVEYRGEVYPQISDVRVVRLEEADVLFGSAYVAFCLMKSEVYELGEYLQVPQSILKAKPSDGLFGDDRSDEDQLKATYDELEWAMLQTEQGHTAEAFTGRQREVFEIYTRLNRANQHKMQPIPICKIDKSAN